MPVKKGGERLENFLKERALALEAKGKNLVDCLRDEQSLAQEKVEVRDVARFSEGY